MAGTVVAAGRIDLAWSAGTDDVAVAGYNVYRDGTKVNAAPVGSLSYSDTGLAAGVSHTYTVSALDAAGNESPVSPTWSGAAASGALTTTYAYDAENRLTALQTGSTVIGTYAYDGAGDRVSKTVAGATTAYTLDLASGLPQVLSHTTGSAVTSYAYAGGPLELDRSGTTYWYLSDTLGSVRLLTDSTGATPATYAYAAFGSTRASTGSIANEVRFSGERTDTESGLEFLRARTYDPSTGTFLQRDTWGISPTDSQSIDAYCYTENSPTNAVDPSGHLSVMYDGGRDVSAPSTGHGGGGSWDTPPKAVDKAASTPQGCSLIPWEGNSCESQAIGGVTNKVTDLAGGVGNAVTNPFGTWANTGGGVVNWAAGHPLEAAAIVAGTALCITAWELCLAGIASYTASTAVSDIPGTLGDGKPILAGWNPADALMAGSGSALLGPFAGGGNVMNPIAGFVVGTGTDVVAQDVKNPGGPINRFEAACQGVAGAGSTQFPGRWVGWAYGVATGTAANGTCSAVSR